MSTAALVIGGWFALSFGGVGLLFLAGWLRRRYWPEPQPFIRMSRPPVLRHWLPDDLLDEAGNEPLCNDPDPNRAAASPAKLIAARFPHRGHLQAPLHGQTMEQGAWKKSRHTCGKRLPRMSLVDLSRDQFTRALYRRCGVGRPLSVDQEEKYRHDRAALVARLPRALAFLAPPAIDPAPDGEAAPAVAPARRAGP